MSDCQYVHFDYYLIIIYCVVAIMYSIIISRFCATIVVNKDEYNNRNKIIKWHNL